MVADRMEVTPMHEVLQNFYGAKYIASLDMSSAFLQVLLEQFSRQLTAFGFESNVHQLKTGPCGFKNSLTAFIRTVEKVWGDCDLNNNLVLYVDDLLIRRQLSQNLPITLI